MEKWLQTVSGDRNDSVSFHTEFIVCDKKIRPFSGFVFLQIIGLIEFILLSERQVSTFQI